jgi:hypothetical protein
MEQSQGDCSVPNLYTRNQGGKSRYYGDLRDIGGGQIALKAPGETRATTSETEALKLLAAKIEEVENDIPVSEPGRLKAFAKEFTDRNPATSPSAGLTTWSCGCRRQWSTSAPIET